MELVTRKLRRSRIESLKKEIRKEKRTLRYETNRHNSLGEAFMPRRIEFRRNVARLRTLERRIELAVSNERGSKFDHADIDGATALLHLNDQV